MSEIRDQFDLNGPEHPGELERLRVFAARLRDMLGCTTNPACLTQIRGDREDLRAANDELERVRAEHDALRAEIERLQSLLAAVQEELRDAKSPNSTPTPLSPRKDSNG